MRAKERRQDAAREALAHPYRAGFDASVASTLDRARRPKGLSGYLSWFLAEWAGEIPTGVHARGVWFDRPTRDEIRDGYSPVGGSLLGAPNLSGSFRRYLEGSPRDTDPDGRYLYPMHATLAEFARRDDPLHDNTYAAHFLLALALNAGDLDFVARSHQMAPQAVRRFTLQCLEDLWPRWQSMPKARDLSARKETVEAA